MSLIGIHLDNLDQIFDQQYNQIKHFQIFVDPIVDYHKRYNKELQYIQKNNIQIAVHSSYTVNISRNWEEGDWWVELVIREIEQASIIGAYCLVLHTGKRLELAESQAINNMYSFLLHINRKNDNRTFKNKDKI